MGAPKGNQFWKARSSHGRGKIFEDPKDLWDAATQYFQWVEDNPLYETKAFAFQGVVTTEELPKMRAMTLGGLFIFLGINRQTFNNYESQEDFLAVVTNIREVIYEQKFTGAAADLLNSNIISRDLGLADKTETSVTAEITPWVNLESGED